MSVLLVHLERFDNLSDVEKECASNNGWGKESASYIRVTHDGETVLIESDAMEPEDARFVRDLSWIIDALQSCYEIGKKDGAKT
jgi:hypothetical protein